MEPPGGEWSFTVTRTTPPVPLLLQRGESGSPPPSVARTHSRARGHETLACEYTDNPDTRGHKTVYCLHVRSWVDR